MRSRTRISWQVLGLLAVGFYVGWASWRVHIDDSDLIDFHQTSLHWWRTGEFTPTLGVRHYLPAFVVIIAPLVAWPLEFVAPLWALLNVGLLLAALRFCEKTIHTPPREPPPFEVRWVWPIVLVLPYAHSAIGLGQVNLLVLFLCVLALTWNARKGRCLGPGVLVALAGAIKLYPLLLIPFWVVRGRWRTGVAAIVFFVLLAGGLSVAGFGWHGAQAAHRTWLAEVRGEQYRTANRPTDSWPRHLMFLPEWNQFLRHNNQSLPAVVRRLTSDLHSGEQRDRPVNVMHLTAGQSRTLYRVMVGGVLILLVWLTGRGRKLQDPAVVLRQGSAWLAGTIAFVPIYWTHYFVLNLPMLSFLAYEVWARRKKGSQAGVPEALFISWLAAIPLLGITVLRLAGLHCWLTMVTMAWALVTALCTEKDSRPVPA